MKTKFLSLISDSIDALQAVKEKADNYQTTNQGTLNSSSYDDWINVSNFCINKLIGCNSLLELREKKLKKIENLSISSLNERVRINLLEVDFEPKDAILLCLTDYMVSSWAFYDRLSNAIGSMTATDQYSKNQIKSCRLPETFTDNKKNDALGSKFHSIIVKNYAWPIMISYKIRNWLIHEGYDCNGNQLFNFSDIEKPKITIPAKKEIEKSINKFKIEMSRSSNDFGNIWDQGFLKPILLVYHSEIDELLYNLLKWSIDSLLSQVKLFWEKDGVL